MDAPTTRRIGRPPKYDWGDKRDICYKLYVEEEKSAEEISKYFSDHFNVDRSELPCRKGFLRQFQLWGFPSHRKRLSAEDEELVLQRMKELWEQNMIQRDIKTTLAGEGFELKHHQFHKLWQKAGLRLRNEQGYKTPSSKKRKANAPAPGGFSDSVPIDAQVDDRADVAHENDASIAAPLDPEEAARRQQRMLEIRLESDQKMQSKKRRRRIRGYGHLPADAPGTAPRYGSETSLDECKFLLHLSNEMYQAVRKDYQTICEDWGIIRKANCVEGWWEASKQRLIRENMHLSAMMHPLQPDQDKKAIALDCLCCDVTKRMRVAGNSITIADANNILGFNPEESKGVRRSMYEILAADKFESKFLCGDEHWQTLRQRWFDTNDALQEAANEGDKNKMRAVDLLCKDATKRFREDKNKRGERLVVQRNSQYGPGPGPAWRGTAPRSKTGKAEVADGVHVVRMRKKTDGEQQNAAPHTGSTFAAVAQGPESSAFELDPALSIAATFLTEPDQAPVSSNISAYFRLSPASRLSAGNHPKMWLGKLRSTSIAALHKAATTKAGAAQVVKVQGIVRNDDGSEDSWLIESQEELEVYLGEAGEKPTFVVVLQGGYA